MKKRNSMQGRAKRLRWLILAMITSVLASCASINTSTAQYVGVRHYPPTNPAIVEIVLDEPAQKHEKLGEIVLSASTYPAPSVSEVEKRLREEAAKMGADAALVVEDGIRPVGTTSSGSWWYWSEAPMEGRKLVSVAIKYR